MSGWHQQGEDTCSHARTRPKLELIQEFEHHHKVRGWPVGRERCTFPKTSTHPWIWKNAILRKSSWNLRKECECVDDAVFTCPDLEVIQEFKICYFGKVNTKQIYKNSLKRLWMWWPFNANSYPRIWKIYFFELKCRGARAIVKPQSGLDMKINQNIPKEKQKKWTVFKFCYFKPIKDYFDD